MAEINPIVTKIIIGARVLHHHGVFNESGTLSVRDPTNPYAFFINNGPPILLSSPSDVSQYTLPTSTAAGQAMDVDTLASDTPNGASTLSEVHLHAAFYTRYSSVTSVVHSSASEFVVYGLCEANGSMARSVFNKAGFVNEYNPIFNTAAYRPQLPSGHPRTLRIDHAVLGDALAQCLAVGGHPDAEPNGMTALPIHRVAFIRGNGAALWAESIEDVVYKAINLKRNAVIQTSAMLQRMNSDLEITYLNVVETIDSDKASGFAIQSAWVAWAAEVSRSALYPD